jgi:hypothetical protein
MPVLSTLGAAAARGFGFLGKVVQAIDEYFEYVTMLLPGNGTNGAQNNTFLDSSTNNFSITRNGNTTQGTFAPYGANWSNFFNGPSSGTYFETPTNTAFQLGTSDFTIEFWVFITSGASQTCVCRTDTGGSAQNGMLLGYSDGTDILWYATSNGSTWNIISGGVLCSVASVKNTWAHFAYVRSGSTFTAYVNGTQAYTTTSSAAINQVTNGFRIGTANTGTGSTNFGGYISNFRYVKGSAVYTANFTPSTAPLTAITNTSLLTCQSNRFIDNSANNFTITRNGDVSVQVFSPFSPTASYAAGTNGGSGYFDGTGDYLSIADNAALELGSSNFCIENWFYQQANSSRSIVNKRANSSSYGLSIFAQNASNSVEVYISSNGSSWGIVNGTSLGTIIPSAWNHVALYRSGNSWYGAMNGTVTLLTTNSSAVVNNSSAWNFGAESDGFGVTGYLADGRIVIGSAVYGASNFTPPTAPLTAITNTQLLLNYTNAGVIDNAMMNNLETVGNAQISTTQSKWGGSSIAFDGTGDVLISKELGAAFTYGTGDYTIEFWVYPTTGATNQRAILGRENTGNVSVPYIYLKQTSGYLAVYYSSDIASTSSAIAQNTWTHIAVCRASGTTRIFVNGTQDGSGADTTNLISPNFITIGASGSGASVPFTGYLDDLRITKGFARYTANFTVPTAPFPTR